MAIILAKFKNRPEPVRFTFGIFELVASDPLIEWIVDGETGEILLEK